MEILTCGVHGLNGLRSDEATQSIDFDIHDIPSKTRLKMSPSQATSIIYHVSIVPSILQSFKSKTGSTRNYTQK
jgi:hypothetical protein